MVSADNLNFDVLELMFSYLSGYDLASIAQVSRSFLAGVIPRLYKIIVYRMSHAKLYSQVMSPFAVILAHPNLAIHVRRVEIRYVPRLESNLKTQPHPRFLLECAKVLTSAVNLQTFTCTPQEILPSFLSSLPNKERLTTLRINAHLTTDQTELLTSITGLKSLTLENASWIVVDSLPKWAEKLQETLTHLTIHLAHDLNDQVLQGTLSHLPKLRGLHIIGCSPVDHVDIIRATSHTPLLESLAMSTTDNHRQLPGYVPALTHLRHLALDSDNHTRNASAAVGALWSAIFSTMNLAASPISSVALRPCMRMPCETVIRDLLKAHANTLRFISLLNCTVDNKQVGDIAQKCVQLERLSLPIMEAVDLRGFRLALAKSSSVHTVVDVGDAHSVHGPRKVLRTDFVRKTMEAVPSLRKVVSENKYWTGKSTPDGPNVHLEKKTPQTTSFWFLPPAFVLEA